VIVACTVYGVRSMPTWTDSILEAATVVAVAFCLWVWTRYDDEKREREDRDRWGRNR